MQLELAKTAADGPPNKFTKVNSESDPEKIIDWALTRFAGRRCIATTSFGMEGCAMLDMIARRIERFDVIYIDTDFFFAETYQLRDRMAIRYPSLRFVRVATELSPDQQAELHGERLWARNPGLCCRIRKVEPMVEAMEGVDVWLTSIRRGQSATRANLQVVGWDWQYDLLKICPLANWSREQVWDYVQRHDVPYNPLHEQGYPSIGCTHCTSRIEGAAVTDYSRDGRWQGFNKTECGLHGDGI